MSSKSDSMVNGSTYSTVTGGATFMDEVHDLIMTKLVNLNFTENDVPVVDFVHPDKLKEIVDLEIGEEGENVDALVDLCDNAIKYGVKTAHPGFFNQLYGGMDPYAIGATYLSEALNTSAYTYEVAPLFTLSEMTVLKKMLSIVDFPEGDGIFCPGASFANIMAMNLARYYAFPEIKQKGMHGIPRLCFFTSRQSHYSFLKGAAFLGIGTDNLIKVDCDCDGQMSVPALKEAIKQAKDNGLTPFMVNATAGTTVLGAFDPLTEISEVCQANKLWMHVDGALGMSLRLSRRYRHLTDGVELADSVSWNAHKLMNVPLQCSVLLVKQKSLLNECYSSQAKYLFQKDKFYDVAYDTGDKTVQCGRKVDAFKLLVSWKASGDAGLDADMENLCNNASYLAELIEETEGFILVRQPQSMNVCFWYVPPSLRDQPRNNEWWTCISRVAPEIKRKMIITGSLMIGYQPLGDLVNFFRVAISNTKSTSEDMDFIVEEIDRLGQEVDRDWTMPTPLSSHVSSAIGSEASGDSSVASSVISKTKSNATAAS